MTFDPAVKPAFLARMRCWAPAAVAAFGIDDLDGAGELARCLVHPA